MQKLAETYGPVVGFFLGPNQPIISICGAKAVKEALHNDGFIGRPNNSLIISRTFEEKTRQSYQGFKAVVITRSLWGISIRSKINL